LTIRRTKFGKSRLVPIHPTTEAALRAYGEARDRIIPKPATPAFFVSERRTRITEWSARYTFAVVSRTVGLRPPTRGLRHGHGPRIQDLRHRFAAQTLITWYRAGVDVERELPKLPTYLGHVHTADTFWFLEHLEQRRGNRSRTRNARLAAIHSFFRYVALAEPAHALLCQQVLAMPSKRDQRKPIAFLDGAEITAVLAAPDLSTWIGRRDRTLLAVAIQTGLRVSALIGLRREDVVLGSGAHVRCDGKGRKQRCTPLGRDTAAILDCWLRRDLPIESACVFPSVRGR